MNPDVYGAWLAAGERFQHFGAWLARNADNLAAALILFAIAAWLIIPALRDANTKVNTALAELDNDSREEKS